MRAIIIVLLNHTQQLLEVLKIVLLALILLVVTGTEIAQAAHMELLITAGAILSIIPLHSQLLQMVNKIAYLLMDHGHLLVMVNVILLLLVLVRLL